MLNVAYLEVLPEQTVTELRKSTTAKSAATISDGQSSETTRKLRAGHQKNDPGGGLGRCVVGGGGGIRTRDLWVMSPTSCRCSTPRRPPAVRRSASRRSPARGPSAWSAARPTQNVGVGGCPQRPRLPQGRPCSTLRRCGGSRPGSGWDRVGPPRSRPRAPPDLHVLPVSLTAHRSGACPPRNGMLVWCLVLAVYLVCTCCVLGVRGAYQDRVVELPVRAASRGCRWSPGRGVPPGERSPNAGLVCDVVVRCPRSLGRVGSGRLPAVHLPPINPVISRGAYLMMSGTRRLGERFPLRCFQRFAQPNVATQRCRLPDNWFTSGSSSPVLSY